MKRNVLALVLALLMVLALAPTAALAAEPEVIWLDRPCTQVGMFSEGLAAVRAGVPGEEDSHVLMFEEELVWVSFQDRNCGFVDTQGRWVVPPKYDRVWSFKDGLAKVRNDELTGLIDTTGKEIVPPRYQYIHEFSEGLAVVEDEHNNFNYIDTTGREVISGDFWHATDFQDGLAIVTVVTEDWKREYHIIDKTGKTLVSLKGYDSMEGNDARKFSDGLAAVVLEMEYGDYGAEEPLWGFIDTAGNVVLPKAYDQVYTDFHNGYAWVRKDGTKGFIDTKGNFTPADYYPRGDFDENGICEVDTQVSEYAWAHGGTFVDTTGKVVPDPKNTLKVEWQGDKAGFVDGSGQMVIPAIYDDAEPFYGGLAAVMKDGYFGYIDKTGQVVIPAEYGYARSFSNGLAVVCNEDGKCGYIDKTGQLVVPFEFYNANHVRNGIAWVAKGPYEFGILKVPTAKTAYASTQNVNVDGKTVEFQCYALKDESGNMTNYIKLRDLADILNGSAAQFEVGWDGSVTITTGSAYTANGSEGSTPYTGDRAYQEATAETKVNGKAATLAAFVLNDDAGGGYTYYQLRDLGKALGFNVGWDAGKGIFLESGKPYDPAN